MAQAGSSSEGDRRHQPAVTILSQLFYPEMVSTGQNLTELAEELVKLGIGVDVICGPPTIVSGQKAPREIVHEGVRVRRVWGTKFGKLSLIGKILNLVSFGASATSRVLADRRQTPLLIVTNPPFLAIAGVLARLVRRRPYIFLIHDVYPDVGFPTGAIRRGGLVCRAWDAANRLMYRRAHAVIVLGRCMAEVVRSERKLGRGGKGRLYTIPVWADDRRIRPMPRSRSPLLARWGLGGKFVVQYSGNMGRIHDMRTIVEGARILSGDKDVHFQFIGAGHARGWVEAYVTEHGLENCSFEGYVSREELGESLAVANVGVLSLARGHAGLAVPSKLYGILAAGRPAVAIMESESEAARVIREERCGVVVAPGDARGFANAISLLKDDTELRRAMGERGYRALRARYTLASAAAQYARVVLSLQPKAAKSEMARTSKRLSGKAGRDGEETRRVTSLALHGLQKHTACEGAGVRHKALSSAARSR